MRVQAIAPQLNAGTGPQVKGNRDREEVRFPAFGAFTLGHSHKISDPINGQRLLRH